MNKTTKTLIQFFKYNACILPFIFLSISCSTDVNNKPRVNQKIIFDTVSNITDTLHANRFKDFLGEKNFISAYHIAKSNLNDSIKSKQLTTLSYKLLKVNDSQYFREVNNKAIQLNKKRLDSASLAATYWDLGNFYKKHMLQDSAYATYYEAQKIYESLGDYLKSGKLLLNMAKTQSNIKDYVGSEATTTKAIEQLKPLKNKQALFRGYNQLGITSGALGEPKKAIDIVADEPTTALDVSIQAQILFQMRDLARETGTALIWISHDLAVVSSLASKLAVMYAGKMVEQGPTATLLRDPRHPYTAGLIASLPATAEPGQPLHQIPGTTPSLLALPEGCPFAPRCARADGACALDPPLAQTDARAWRCVHPVGLTGEVAG